MVFRQTGRDWKWESKLTVVQDGVRTDIHSLGGVWGWSSAAPSVLFSLLPTPGPLHSSPSTKPLLLTVGRDPSTAIRRLPWPPMPCWSVVVLAQGCTLMTFLSPFSMLPFLGSLTK